jgi:hypothetical protein
MCVCTRVKREKLLPTTIAKKKADSDRESGNGRGSERKGERESESQKDRQTENWELIKHEIYRFLTIATSPVFTVSPCAGMRRKFTAPPPTLGKKSEVKYRR